MISKKSLAVSLLSLSVLALTACGGGGSDSATPGSGGGSGNATPTAPTWVAGQFPAENTFKNFCQTPRTGTDPYNSNRPYPDRAGTAMHEKMWLRSWTNNTYLWYREVVDRDPSPYNVEQYFNLLKTEQLTDSGTPKDNFHFTENTAEYQQQTQAGVSAGYGIRWFFGRNRPPRELIIAYTEPGSPAANAGLMRGDKLLSVNGFDFINDSSQTAVDLFNRMLAPAGTGQRFDLVFESATATRKSVSLTSANVASVPVQNVRVLETPAGKVGYLQFNSYIALAQQQLINAVNQFSTANIDELVIDMRYNGGGLLALASQLGYMISGPAIIQDRFFERTIFNDKYPNTNPVTGQQLSPVPFYSTVIDYEAGRLTNTRLPSLNLSRIFVLSTNNTCSASEALINGLRGIDVEVILVGGRTCGKPYGFYPTDNCGTTYFTIQFTGINAKGFGEFADGFIPKANPIFQADLKGCPLNDDFSKQLGDPTERLLGAAVYYAQNERCPQLEVSSAQMLDSNTLSDTESDGSLSLLDPRYRDIVFNNKLLTELQPAKDEQ